MFLLCLSGLSQFVYYSIEKLCSYMISINVLTARLGVSLCVTWNSKGYWGLQMVGSWIQMTVPLSAGPLYVHQIYSSDCERHTHECMLYNLRVLTCSGSSSCLLTSPTEIKEDKCWLLERSYINDLIQVNAHSSATFVTKQNIVTRKSLEEMNAPQKPIYCQ